MNPSEIYAKTDRGLQELRDRTLNLPATLRGLLIMIDGNRVAFTTDAQMKVRTPIEDFVNTYRALQVTVLSPTDEKRCDERLDFPRLVVPMQRPRPRRNRVAREQRRRDTRVLCGDDLGAREDVERTQRHVAQVTDRRRHHI